jgi:hypothetical protein
MIPTNGVLIGLGKADLDTTVTVPAGTTHFSFGYTSSSDKSRTHGHVKIGGANCILQSGVIYCLHTHSYKPAIAIESNATDKFGEVSFYRIDTRP